MSSLEATELYAQKERINMHWFVCEDWNYESRRWNEEEPLLGHYTNPQKRNFREKFSRTVILLFTCICCFWNYHSHRTFEISRNPRAWYPIDKGPTESRNIHFCIIVGFNLFIKMSESIHHRPKSFVQYILGGCARSTSPSLALRARLALRAPW